MGAPLILSAIVLLSAGGIACAQGEPGPTATPPLACPGLFRHTISDHDSDTHDNVDS